jgi:hypothetical protein
MTNWDEGVYPLRQLDNGVRLFTVDKQLQLGQMQAQLAIAEELAALRTAGVFWTNRMLTRSARQLHNRPMSPVRAAFPLAR